MPARYPIILYRKYRALFRIWMSRILVYRARITIYFIMDGLNLVVFPFIWLAVYGSRSNIAGFGRADIVTYYIVLAIISTLATSHCGRLLTREILRGEINQNLTRPLHHLLFLICHDVVYHVALIGATVFFVAATKLLAPSYVRLPGNPFTYLYFFLALIGAYWLSTCLEILTGLMAFWFGDTGGLSQARQMTTIILSGAIAPLAFFPPLIQTFAKVFPFQWLAYAPAQIFLEKITGWEIVKTFTQEALWCAGLAGLMIWLWKRGLRHYEGVGL